MRTSTPLEWSRQSHRGSHATPRTSLSPNRYQNACLWKAASPSASASCTFDPRGIEACCGLSSSRATAATRCRLRWLLPKRMVNPALQQDLEVALAKLPARARAGARPEDRSADTATADRLLDARATGCVQRNAGAACLRDGHAAPATQISAALSACGGLAEVAGPGAVTSRSAGFRRQGTTRRGARQDNYTGATHDPGGRAVAGDLCIDSLSSAAAGRHWDHQYYSLSTMRLRRSVAHRGA